MIGLEYIAKTFHVEYKEIAVRLSIKPQTINSWLRGKRPIPEKQLQKLSKIFELDSDYFTRELTSEEKLDIQIHKLKKEAKSLGFEIEVKKI